MKNRLEQLLNGQFEYDLPHMQLSGRTVRIETEAGARAKGAFLVAHPGEGKVRGFLNTDNPRILLESPEFYGHENIVRFDVDTEGLLPGETDAVRWATFAQIHEMIETKQICSIIAEQFLLEEPELRKRQIAQE